VSNGMNLDQKKKVAADCFRKGNEAMEKGNFDYAVKMHSTAVQLIPDNLMFRQTLRGCERRLYNNNKSGARLAGLRLTSIRGKIKKARSKSEWSVMDQAAEEGLTLNPWDSGLNSDLAQACFNLGYAEIAVFAYETAVENDADNVALLEKFAELCETRGEFKKGIECWRRIAKLQPNNGQARSKMMGLEAKQVMERGGYEGAKNTQEVRRNAYDDYRPSTERYVPDTVAGPGVSLEADLQRAIRKNPADKGNYIKLAEFYQRQKEFEKAGAALKQALEVSGGDYNIREIFENNDITRMKYELDLAKEAAAEDEALQKTVDAMKRELHLREIEVLSSRIERYPMDANLKHQLALKYMKSKEYKKAIPLLQQATADQRHAGEVLVALGKCFIADHQSKLARHQFESAVEKLNPHDNAEAYCEAYYILGRLCEEAKERDNAEDAYSKVLSVNYSYKDARERLERLQREGGDGPPKKKPG
jgi:tetratricopeptide (TPR) repeat protein